MADLDALIAQANEQLGNAPISTAKPEVGSVSSAEPSWWERLTSPTSPGGLAYDVAAAVPRAAAGITDVAMLPLEAGHRLMTALRPYNPFDMTEAYRADPTTRPIIEKALEEESKRSWFPRSQAISEDLAKGAEALGVPVSPTRQELISSLIPIGEVKTGLGLVKEAGTGLASYLAGEAGTGLTDNPYIGAVASFLPILGGKVAAKVAPRVEDIAKIANKEHNAAVVANLIEKEVPLSKITPAIKEAKNNPLYGAMTTADVLGTPESALIETGLGSTARYQSQYRPFIQSATSGVQESMLQEAEKQAVKRATKAGDLTPQQLSTVEKINPADVGTKIQEVTTAVRKADDAAVRSLYAQVDDTIPVTKSKTILAPIQDLIAEKYPSKKVKSESGNIESQISRRAPDALKKFVGDLTKDLNAPGGMSLKDMWLYRSDALEFANTLKRTQPRAATVFGDIGRVLHDKITSLGGEGKAWKEANDAAKEFFAKHDEGLLAKTLASEDILPDRLPKDLLKSTEMLNQLETMVGAEHPVFDTLRVNVINELKNKTPEARARFIRDKQPQLQKLFGSDFDYLENTAGAIEKEIAKEKAVVPRGSQTQPKGEAKKLVEAIQAGERPALSAVEKVQAARRLGQEAVIGGLLGHALSAANPVLGTVVGTGVGYGSKLIKAALEDARANALYDIMMNPKKAEQAAIAGQMLTSRREALSRALTPSLASQRGSLGQIPVEEKASESSTMAPTSQSSSQDVDALINELKGRLGPSTTQPSNSGKLDVSYLAEQQSHVDPSLVKAVIHTESAGNAKARSKKGAQGLMQIMPETAKELGIDPTDPEQNVEGGSRYLAKLLDNYNGDEELALAAYNWGLGNVNRGLGKLEKADLEPTWDNLKDYVRVPSETQKYVAKVLTTRNRLEA